MVTFCPRTHPHSQMPEWIVYPLAIGGYFALMRWVLPKLGVGT